MYGRFWGGASSFRGIYWREMPGYAPLPAPRAYWSGETDMTCVGGAMANVSNNGYAHHTQKRMVLGLVALVASVPPNRFHKWNMAMYLDAIGWASLSNTLDMSQFGDGGLMWKKHYLKSAN